MTPEFTPVPARVTATLLHIASHPYPTLGTCQQAAGDRSTASTSARLHKLRAEGLVAFEPGRLGTLRPSFVALTVQTRKGEQG